MKQEGRSHALLLDPGLRCRPDFNGDGTVRAPEQRRVSRRFGLAKAEASSVSTSLMEQRDCRLRASSAPGRSPAALSLVAHFPKLRARTSLGRSSRRTITPNQRLLVQRWQLLPAVCPEVPVKLRPASANRRICAAAPLGPVIAVLGRQNNARKVKRTQWHLDPGIGMHESAKNAIEARQKFSEVTWRAAMIPWEHHKSPRAPHDDSMLSATRSRLCKPSTPASG